jgi:type II restriction/modification system DNA methylase subunit YeeA
METLKLKRFAQYARRSLLEQVSAKLKLVLAENSAARRERAEAIKKLEEAIKGHGKEQVIERVAYIWFNRFCALRFMDVNRYNRVNIVSPADPGQFQPEILAEAKMGHIDEEMVHDKVRQQIFALLDGKAPSRDPQGEAYRLLVVAACNFWNKAMPFLFQRIDDYTELLMPDDLLSGNSILAYTREAMTPDACEDVEVIGWLYQFYISEKKDEVFDGLKKNKKITPENIPAATQLFTPHWIVRYLVENSLGRLWLLNRPGSKLVEQMDYYIKPEQAETDFLRIAKPEEIKICDPACGSGHMLTYAFDLLYAIYEEEGYEPAEIPEKILTNNLYGIEIDERAGELAAFALTMKARSKQRRFFNKGVKPNICVLENVHFDGTELKDYMDFVGRDLFTAPLQTTLRQFEEADNFGSLIRPDVSDVDGMLGILESKNVSGHLFLSMTHQKVLQALRQADYLSPKYHVVIANPPYMGGRGMNGRLASWVKDNYPNTKSDLFAMFIERNLDLAQKHGAVAMITMHSWMFLSSFELLRSRVLGQDTILSMAHLGPRAFDSIGGEVVSTTAFVLENANRLNYKGGYLRLVAGNSEAEKNDAIREAVKNPKCGWFYRASANDFRKIPGEPIAYWATPNQRSAFDKFPAIGSWAPVKQGLATADNNRFVRTWNEISINKLGLGYESTDQTQNSKHKWFPYNKGGDFRKWYGNFEFVVLWENDGHEIRNFADDSGYIRSRAQNTNYYFKQGVTWTFISSSKFGVRYAPSGSVFDVAGSSAFPPVKYAKRLTAFLASNLSWGLLKLLNPTLNFQVGNVASLPLSKEKLDCIPEEVSDSLILQTKLDWDSYETSWDFTSLPLLNPDNRQPTIKATYQKLRAHWREMTLEMQRLEEENNRIFIDAYGLQDELTPEVPLTEITLTCNPHYRYGGDKSEEELEALLLADTMRELVSYAVGCMFGRYALDKPGLILANQGETIEDYYKILLTAKNAKDAKEDQENNFSDFSAFRGSIAFPADDDNVIPMLDGDWFTDDIAERFRKFLRVAFGDEHYEANLKFVEKALNIKGKRNYSIRDYFLGEFYTDHVKRYKKRPIYWLFSSPKGSFNALIYMHRYRPDTASVVLNDYLREFRTKLTSHKNHLEAVSISASSSQGEKTKALKEIEKITKMIAEMEEYEREVLYPLATEQVEIDLDDGVKVNYPKLGAALKKIVGLDAKED